MSAGRPTRLVQFTLMAALLGIAVPFAVSATANAPSYGLVAMCTGYVLQCLNFFHGKIATLEDEDYTRVVAFQPRLALFDYAANLGIVMTMVLISVLLTQPVLVCIVNVVLRGLDQLLVLRMRSVSLSPRVRRAQASWAIFNKFAIVVWIVAAVVASGLSPSTQLSVVGFVFFGLVLADIAMDYTYNSELYFGRSSQWDAVADLWDELQGELGDSYRQHVVYPGLLDVVGDRALRVLDIGAGNGCVARFLVAKGHDVVGIDSSDRMIGHAKSYIDPDETAPAFFVASVGASQLPPELDAARFDVCVCCFSQQDMPSLGACFAFAARMLARDGRLIIVYEDLAALQGDPQHETTDRRWLSVSSPFATSRRQLVFWGKTSGSDVLHATETTIYSELAYRECADWKNLTVQSVRRLVPDDCPDVLTRRYRLNPRFAMMVLTKASPTGGPAQAEPQAGGGRAR